VIILLITLGVRRGIADSVYAAVTARRAAARSAAVRQREAA